MNAGFGFMGLLPRLCWPIFHLFENQSPVFGQVEYSNIFKRSAGFLNLFPPDRYWFQNASADFMFLCRVIEPEPLCPGIAHTNARR